MTLRLTSPGSEVLHHRIAALETIRQEHLKEIAEYEASIAVLRRDIATLEATKDELRQDIDVLTRTPERS